MEEKEIRNNMKQKTTPRHKKEGEGVCKESEHCKECVAPSP